MEFFVSNALPTNTGNIETFIASTDPRDNVFPQGTDFGYFGGGEPGPKSTVDRIDYSNDTATAVAKGPLSLHRRYIGATGNANFGYFGGGDDSGVVSRIDRIDYSNDTATASQKGQLSSTRGYPAGFSAAAAKATEAQNALNAL